MMLDATDEEILTGWPTRSRTSGQSWRTGDTDNQAYINNTV